jgi:hypothetical protein
MKGRLMHGRVIFDDMVLPLFQARRGDWITAARAIARELAAAHGQVTIDDVRLRFPPPEGADPRIMGSVFAKGAFVRIGFAASRRDACHGRMIGVFKLRE